MKLQAVSGRRSIRLSDADARFHFKHASDEGKVAAALDEQTARIAELQRLFYADARHALLVVLQGRDASGKDGTIRRVFGAVNPQGCTVANFKAPTELEQQHDFLWRIHQQVPARGTIAVFNRSHYEDILVPRVRGTLPKKVWSGRYEQINGFERMLADNGVVILKFMLHVSGPAQKKRLAERLTDKTKNWKFREGDLEDRKLWDAFTDAYRGILSHTSTKYAPWYVVPADDNHVRELLVARTIADRLASLHLRYPPADPAILKLKVR